MEASPKIIVGMFQFSGHDCPNLEAALGLAPAFESQGLDNLRDAAAFVACSAAALVVVGIGHKDDLLKLAALVKVERQRPTRLVRFLIVNSIPQFDKAISKLGLRDYLDGAASVKSLRFKLDFWKRSVLALVKSSQPKDIQAKQLAEVAVRQDNIKKTGANGIQWITPLEHPDDIWIIRSETDCTNRLNKFLVRVMAPSPYVAKWIVTDTRDTWEFKLKDTKSFLPKGGRWFYKGSQKPEFIWEENIWLIVGEKCELYIKVGDERLDRLQTQNGTLSVTRNSEAAKAKQRAIIDTFDRDLVYSLEKLAEGKAEVDADEGWGLQNLDGKGKTEHIDASALSGDVEGTDHLPTGDMEGELKETPERPMGELALGQVKAVSPLLAAPHGGNAATGAELSLEAKQVERAKLLDVELDQRGSTDELSGEGAAADRINKYLGLDVSEREISNEGARTAPHESSTPADIMGRASDKAADRDSQEKHGLKADRLGRPLAGKSEDRELPMGAAMDGEGSAADRLSTHYGRSASALATSAAKARSVSAAGALTESVDDARPASATDAELATDELPPQGEEAGKGRGQREMRQASEREPLVPESPERSGARPRERGNARSARLSSKREGEEDVEGQDQDAEGREAASPQPRESRAKRQLLRDESASQSDHKKSKGRGSADDGAEDNVVDLAARAQAKKSQAVDALRMFYDKAAKQHRRS